jgi:hypothetical protein
MRPRVNNMATRVAVGVVCAALFSGCAWHRVASGAARPQPERTREVVGIAAADAETSLSDLQTIARLWSSWQSFEGVQFPFREGDPVDLVVEVRLRQRADAHRSGNALKAVANGLTLGLMTPFLGSRITEIHDVRARCARGGAGRTAVDLQVSTDAEFGYMADAAATARALDDEQMKRVASEVLRIVLESCR